MHVKIINDVRIFLDMIDAMYDACRYQKAWSVTELSPWCAVFSKEELRVLEYREDLDYYYKAGYGRDINTRLGCPLLHDMMRHFWYYKATSSVANVSLLKFRKLPRILLKLPYISNFIFQVIDYLAYSYFFRSVLLPRNKNC